MPVLSGIDYYGVLGLTREAEINDIKHAYRRVAAQYNANYQGNPEISKLFSIAGEAYEILSSEELRAIYDKYGEKGLKKGVLTPAGWHPPYIYHGNPIKTYREFFGSKNPYADLLNKMDSKSDIAMCEDGKGPKKKQETQVKPLALTLEEVYKGTVKKMKIVRRVFKEDGETTELREKVLVMEIRKGTPPGTEILFAGVGDSGPLTIPGDVKYITEDLPHPIFTREGLNLVITKEVNLIDALGGMVLSINTLDGRTLKTRITEVIRPGYVKIIHGEGMPDINDNEKFGDLQIKFNVAFPTYIPDVCKSLISKCLNEAEELNNKGEKDEKGNELERSCKPTKEIIKMF